MTYKIFFHPKAKKIIDKLDNKLRERIKTKIITLKEKPDKKGERLKYSDFWKLRIGDYRVVYEIDKQNKNIIVLFIGHIKKVYDDFSKLF